MMRKTFLIPTVVVASLLPLTAFAQPPLPIQDLPSIPGDSECGPDGRPLKSSRYGANPYAGYGSKDRRSIFEAVKENYRDAKPKAEQQYPLDLYNFNMQNIGTYGQSGPYGNGTAYGPTTKGQFDKGIGTCATWGNTGNFIFGSSRSFFGESSREFFERPPAVDGVRLWCNPVPVIFRRPPYGPDYLFPTWRQQNVD